VLDTCERHGIAFLPWAPLASGLLARTEWRCARDGAEGPRTAIKRLSCYT
jgi:aryl-alcohol dehydrogenase-like predicted oxidoreductase